MKKPHFEVRSLTVKTMVVQGQTVHRHFFEWLNRSSLDQCYLRLLLIRQDGTSIGDMHDLKFPKVKQLGTLTVEENGQKLTKPHYNASTHFFVDADEIAAGFDYYTATLTKKSDPTVAVISKKREDLRLAHEKV
ncbi:MULTISPECIES: hypothetical protein [unclassified Spirosoma]|uniref:hypothetical protein n=1 Tax=unclassified Spirosoma TaxID=2621999 RepID=UPI000A8DFB09|nr:MULTISPECIES: hypothetical protein [unclassified Spirosoma]MBN8824431.1 hypothetical protein [Spirosoma sp.]